MLRWAARVLRWLAVLAGAVAIAWMPFSRNHVGSLNFSVAKDTLCFFSFRGAVGVSFLITTPETKLRYAGEFEESLRHAMREANAALPQVNYSKPIVIGTGQHRPDIRKNHASYNFSVPLWMVSAICLAWPVTSFIVAWRRRKGRGFEVEARPSQAPRSPRRSPELHCLP